MSPWGTSSLLSSRQDTYIVENLPKVAHSPALVFHASANFFLAAEDSLNISLKDITVTGRDGRVSQLDQVYIRGSMVRFFIVPDMLQNAPMYVMQSFRATSIF
jgi:LSM domain-containing protein